MYPLVTLGTLISVPVDLATPTLPKIEKRTWVLVESFPCCTWPWTSKLHDFTKPLSGPQY